MQSRLSQFALELTKLCEIGFSVIAESKMPKRKRTRVGSAALSLKMGEAHWRQKMALFTRAQLKRLQHVLTFGDH